MLVGITGMSMSPGANAVQWTDNGTLDHEWLLTLLSDGNYKIFNHNSGGLLGVYNMSTSDGANIVQWTDNGTADHEWKLTFVP